MSVVKAGLAAGARLRGIGDSESRLGHEVGRLVCGPVKTWPGRSGPGVTGPRESHPLEVQGTQARSGEGTVTLCNK